MGDDDPEQPGAARLRFDRDEPGFFRLPDDCRDLFEVFLSPPVRQARREAIDRVDQSNAPEPVKSVARSLITVQAITAQGRLKRQEKRQLNRRGR